jgi:hypothetical protein
MRANEGDASQGDTSKFTAGDSFAVDIVGGGCLFISLVWWLSDLRLVARNRLQYVEETSLWWNAFVVWGSPVGLLGGFHFKSFERPYDWQLFCSLSTIGILTGLTSRQYAAVGRRDEAGEHACAGEQVEGAALPRSQLVGCRCPLTESIAENGERGGVGHCGVGREHPTIMKCSGRGSKRCHAPGILSGLLATGPTISTSRPEEQP